MTDDAGFLRLLEVRLEKAARKAGARMACRRGCTECCIGPFPITALDGERLRRGLDVLERSDPAAAGRVRERAKRQILRMTPAFPGDPDSGILSDDDGEVDAFLEAERSVPCPALDPDAGTCDLYAWRPVSCRTYGFPLRVGQEDLPPCRLCFVDAAPHEVEAHRVDPDPEGIEDALLPDPGETVVAFALR